MFEQSTLPNGPAGKRVWTTFVGLSSEIGIVVAMIVAPLIWPDVLPKAVAYVRLLPVPPPAPPGPPPPTKPAVTAVVPVHRQYQGGLFVPRTIPPRAVIIEDAPDLPPGVVGGISLTGGSGSGGNATGVLGAITYPPVIAPPLPVENSAPPAPPKAAPRPIRVRVGGLVKQAILIHRVEPKYPQLAVQSRLTGVVELEGVIGVDGRLRELKVIKGHPFFVRAALEAVSQWIYAPTTLNGDPVEVIAPIVVTFRLN